MNTILLAGGRIRGSLCGGAISPGMRRGHGTFGNLSLRPKKQQVRRIWPCRMLLVRPLTKQSGMLFK
jgi:hypothetical protein